MSAAALSPCARSAAAAHGAAAPGPGSGGGGSSSGGGIGGGGDCGFACQAPASAGGTGGGDPGGGSAGAGSGGGIPSGGRGPAGGGAPTGGSPGGVGMPEDTEQDTVVTVDLMHASSIPEYCSCWQPYICCCSRRSWRGVQLTGIWHAVMRSVCKRRCVRRWHRCVRRPGLRGRLVAVRCGVGSGPPRRL